MRNTAQPQLTAAAVADPSGQRRDESAGGAGQAKQPDRGRAVVVGRGAEQERDRGPKDGEDGELQRAEGHALSQHRFLGDQRDDRAQNRPVGDALGRRDDRQRAPEGGREDEHPAGRERVHEPPAAERGDHAAEGACHEDADQQAAHHRADDLAALVRRRERRGERHDHLRDNRQRAERDHRSGEQGEARRRSARRGGHGGPEQDRGDQPPALDDVADRDE